MLIEKLTVGPLEENCYLVGVAPRCAVVDPGAESPRIFAAIERRKLVPEAILLTHGHVDHIAHCAHVAERYGIGVHVHRADLPYLEKPQWPELETYLGARPCPKPAGFLDGATTVEFAGLTLKQALDMAGRNPAVLLGYEDVRLRRGARADLIQFRWQAPGDPLTVEATVLAGELVFRATESAFVAA